MVAFKLWNVFNRVLRLITIYALMMPFSSFLYVASLAIGGAPQTADAADIFACKNNNDGTLRIVDGGTTCKKSETKISWPSVDTDTLRSLTCPSGQVLKYFGNSWNCAQDNDTDTDTLRSLACSRGQTAKFNGTAWVCDPPRFELRTHSAGEQTLYDNDTGLEWEMKIACGAQSGENPRCVENRYSWSASFDDPDGTLFRFFLPKLNDSAGSISKGSDSLDLSLYRAGCYAGHCDWRIPTIFELLSITMFGGNVRDILGPAASSDYWSSTTPFNQQGEALGAYGLGGDAVFLVKGWEVYAARAVRSGR